MIKNNGSCLRNTNSNVKEPSENKVFINIAQWCNENDSIDYLTTLKILKQQKVSIFRIGTDYLVNTDPSGVERP